MAPVTRLQQKRQGEEQTIADINDETAHTSKKFIIEANPDQETQNASGEHNATQSEEVTQISHAEITQPQRKIGQNKDITTNTLVFSKQNRQLFTTYAEVTEEISSATLLTKIRRTLKECIRTTAITSLKSFNDIMHVKIAVITDEELIKAKAALRKVNIPTKSLSEIQPFIHEDRPIKPRTNEIVVKDIPLNVDKENVRENFSYFGQIEDIKLTAKNNWQIANIFYTENEDAQRAGENWSTSIDKDSVRIFPAENFETHLGERNHYTLKLLNLPFNTTAFDLHNVLETFNGRTCFIPRGRTSYKRLRYAFVSFENEKDYNAALNCKSSILMDNFQLTWAKTDTSTCQICTNPNHKAANCPVIQERERNQKRIQKLAELYKRKNVQADNVQKIFKKAENIKNKQAALRPATKNPNRPEARLTDQGALNETKATQYRDAAIRGDINLSTQKRFETYDNQLIDIQSRVARLEENVAKILQFIQDFPTINSLSREVELDSDSITPITVDLTDRDNENMDWFETSMATPTRPPTTLNKGKNPATSKLTPLIPNNKHISLQMPPHDRDIFSSTHTPEAETSTKAEARNHQKQIDQINNKLNRLQTSMETIAQFISNVNQ